MHFLALALVRAFVDVASRSRQNGRQEIRLEHLLVLIPEVNNMVPGSPSQTFCRLALKSLLSFRTLCFVKLSFRFMEAGLRDGIPFRARVPALYQRNASNAWASKLCKEIRKLLGLDGLFNPNRALINPSISSWAAKIWTPRTLCCMQSSECHDFFRVFDPNSKLTCINSSSNSIKIGGFSSQRHEGMPRKSVSIVDTYNTMFQKNCRFQTFFHSGMGSSTKVYSFSSETQCFIIFSAGSNENSNKNNAL